MENKKMKRILPQVISQLFTNKNEQEDEHDGRHDSNQSSELSPNTMRANAQTIQHASMDNNIDNHMGKRADKNTVRALLEALDPYLELETSESQKVHTYNEVNSARMILAQDNPNPQIIGRSVESLTSLLEVAREEMYKVELNASNESVLSTIRELNMVDTKRISQELSNVINSEIDRAHRIMNQEHPAIDDVNKSGQSLKELLDKAQDETYRTQRDASKNLVQGRLEELRNFECSSFTEELQQEIETIDNTVTLLLSKTSPSIVEIDYAADELQNTIDKADEATYQIRLGDCKHAIHRLLDELKHFDTTYLPYDLLNQLNQTGEHASSMAAKTRPALADITVAKETLETQLTQALEATYQCQLDGVKTHASELLGKINNQDETRLVEALKLKTRTAVKDLIEKLEISRPQIESLIHATEVLKVLFETAQEITYQSYKSELLVTNHELMNQLSHLVDDARLQHQTKVQISLVLHESNELTQQSRPDINELTHTNAQLEELVKGAQEEVYQSYKTEGFTEIQSLMTQLETNIDIATLSTSLKDKITQGLNESHALLDLETPEITALNATIATLHIYVDQAMEEVYLSHKIEESSCIGSLVNTLNQSFDTSILSHELNHAIATTIAESQNLISQERPDILHLNQVKEYLKQLLTQAHEEVYCVHNASLLKDIVALMSHLESLFDESRISSKLKSQLSAAIGHTKQLVNEKRPELETLKQRKLDLQALVDEGNEEIYQSHLYETTALLSNQIERWQALGDNHVSEALQDHITATINQVDSLMTLPKPDYNLLIQLCSNLNDFVNQATHETNSYLLAQAKQELASLMEEWEGFDDTFICPELRLNISTARANATKVLYNESAIHSEVTSATTMLKSYVQPAVDGSYQGYRDIIMAYHAGFSDSAVLSLTTIIHDLGTPETLSQLKAILPSLTHAKEGAINATVYELTHNANTGLRFIKSAYKASISNALENVKSINAVIENATDFNNKVSTLKMLFNEALFLTVTKGSINTVGSKLHYAEHGWTVLMLDDNAQNALILSDIVSDTDLATFNLKGPQVEAGDKAYMFHHEGMNAYAGINETGYEESQLKRINDLFYERYIGMNTDEASIVQPVTIHTPLTTSDFAAETGYETRIDGNTKQAFALSVSDYNKIKETSDASSLGDMKNSYWLRSPGLFSSYAAAVFADGSLHNYTVNNTTIRTRVALWINIE